MLSLPGGGELSPGGLNLVTCSQRMGKGKTPPSSDKGSQAQWCHVPVMRPLMCDEKGTSPLWCSSANHNLSLIMRKQMNPVGIFLLETQPAPLKTVKAMKNRQAEKLSQARGDMYLMQYGVLVWIIQERGR